ncbi:hypothetical protein QRE66_17875 [Bacillus cereus]|nr:hypothetical protein QRE66_17875 [Bacillus cereus]
MWKLKHWLIKVLVGKDSIMLNMDVSGEMKINNKPDNRMLIKHNTFRGI